MKFNNQLSGIVGFLCMTSLSHPVACQTPAKLTQSSPSTDSIMRLKVDSRLLTAIRERKTGNVENAAPVMLQEDSTGTVRLEIKGKFSDSLMRFLQSSGASNLKNFNQFDVLQCGLPLDAIEKVALRKDIEFLRPAPMMQLDREPR